MIIPFVRSNIDRLPVHDRFCAVLREERLRTGKSLAAIAGHVGISEREFAAWETGVSSPPANKYYSAITFLGVEAYRKAATLWTNHQVETANARLKRFETYQSIGQGDSVGYVLHRVA